MKHTLLSSHARPERKNPPRCRDAAVGATGRKQQGKTAVTRLASHFHIRHDMLKDTGNLISNAERMSMLLNSEHMLGDHPGISVIVFSCGDTPAWTRIQTGLHTIAGILDDLDH